MVSRCGHTVCEFCCRELKKCPLCKHAVNQATTIRNYGMLDEQAEQNRQQSGEVEIRGQAEIRQKHAISENPLDPLDPLDPINEQNEPNQQDPQPEEQFANGLCPRGHPLALYSKPTKQLQCNVCARTIRDQYMSCRVCDVDVCCVEPAFQIPQNSYKCPRKHQLGYCPNSNQSLICNECRTDLRRSHWSCRNQECDYDVCSNCVNLRVQRRGRR